MAKKDVGISTDLRLACLLGDFPSQRALPTKQDDTKEAMFLNETRLDTVAYYNDFITADPGSRAPSDTASLSGAYDTRTRQSRTYPDLIKHGHLVADDILIYAGCPGVRPVSASQSRCTRSPGQIEARSELGHGLDHARPRTMVIRGTMTTR
ncbi:hypothetical protein RRG08_027695 [Elysia crispata]|uniref:Uncharacterized protein n=1 Tax=Elysia crispata TaxID=231223 RepID=A0AAE1CIX9_9GAST|nr:hypothetical protein RRG08_027695 [Elysia crispata]